RNGLTYCCDVPCWPGPSHHVVAGATGLSYKTNMPDEHELPTSGYPRTRLRRLRYQPLVRELVRETRLSPANFILPLFVRAGRNVKQEIGSMPGHFQWSPDRISEELSSLADLGLGGVLLF